MTQITLTSDQSRLFASATDGVVFCDAAGNIVARVPPTRTETEAAIVEEAKRRLSSDQPRRASASVLERIGIREPR
jgi:hypothetical protein